MADEKIPTGSNPVSKPTLENKPVQPVKPALPRQGQPSQVVKPAAATTAKVVPTAKPVAPTVKPAVIPTVNPTVKPSVEKKPIIEEPKVKEEPKVEEEPKVNPSPDPKPSEEDITIKVSTSKATSEKESESSKKLKSASFDDITTSIMAQMCSYENLKRLQPFAGVLWAILFIPFFLAACVLFVVDKIFLFVFKMLATPSDYLVSRLEDDAPSMPTQIVTYVCGYPVVFIFRIITSFLSLVFFVLHFFINIFCYIYSFGGVTWHPFLFDKGYHKKEFPSKKAPVGHNIAVYIICTILILSIVAGIAAPIIDDAMYEASLKVKDNNPATASASSYEYASDAYEVYKIRDVEFSNISSYQDYLYINIRSNYITYIQIVGTDSNFTVVMDGQTLKPDKSNTVLIQNVEYSDTIKINFEPTTKKRYSGSSIKALIF